MNCLTGLYALIIAPDFHCPSKAKPVSSSKVNIMVGEREESERVERGKEAGGKRPPTKTTNKKERLQKIGDRNKRKNVPLTVMILLCYFLFVFINLTVT